jgi:hypothetical protein
MQNTSFINDVLFTGSSLYSEKEETAALDIYISETGETGKGKHSSI